jgi:hypothetical protein
MEEEQNKLALGVRRLRQLQEATGSLAADRAEMLHKLEAASSQRQQAVTEKRAQLAAQEAAMLAIKDAYVRVVDTIHPGTRVVIGKSSYFTRDRSVGGVFRLEGGEVTYGRD